MTARAEIVRSPSGGTHIYRRHGGEDIYSRRTLCGLTIMGWEHLDDLDDRFTVGGAVSCSRCRKQWEKR